MAKVVKENSPIWFFVTVVLSVILVLSYVIVHTVQEYQSDNSMETVKEYQSAQNELKNNNKEIKGDIISILLDEGKTWIQSTTVKQYANDKLKYRVDSSIVILCDCGNELKADFFIFWDKADKACDKACKVSGRTYAAWEKAYPEERPTVDITCAECGKRYLYNYKKRLSILDGSIEYVPENWGNK